MFLKIAPTVVSPVYIFQLQWLRDYIALHIHAEDSSGMSEIIIVAWTRLAQVKKFSNSDCMFKMEAIRMTGWMCGVKEKRKS